MSIPQTNHCLSSESLPVLRDQRYLGDGLSVTLGAFAPADQLLLRQLYGQLRLVYDTWLYMGRAQDGAIMEQLFRTAGPQGAHARALGEATHADPSQCGQTNLQITQIVHDLRGGGLAPLLGYLEMLNESQHEFSEGDLKRCVSLARDHAKVMRNAVTDLDPWILRSDRLLSLRSVQQDVAKWGATRYRTERGAVAVRSSARCQGFLSARASEAAAVDRVAANLVNNAALFAADLQVELVVEQVGNLLRWVISNRVDEEQQSWLRQHTAPGSHALFHKSVTRDGMGVELGSCAELVARCFGLSNSDDAVEKGYLGCALDGSHFTTWFHWPAYHHTDPQTLAGLTVASDSELL